MWAAALFAVVWLLAVAFVLALCRAAAMADRNAPSPPVDAGLRIPGSRPASPQDKP